MDPNHWHTARQEVARSWWCSIGFVNGAPQNSMVFITRKTLTKLHFWAILRHIQFMTLWPSRRITPFIPNHQLCQILTEFRTSRFVRCYCVSNKTWHSMRRISRRRNRRNRRNMWGNRRRAMLVDAYNSCWVSWGVNLQLDLVINQLITYNYGATLITMGLQATQLIPKNHRPESGIARPNASNTTTDIVAAAVVKQSKQSLKQEFVMNSKCKVKQCILTNLVFRLLRSVSHAGKWCRTLPFRLCQYVLQAGVDKIRQFPPNKEHVLSPKLRTISGFGFSDMLISIIVISTHKNMHICIYIYTYVLCIYIHIMLYIKLYHHFLLDDIISYYIT